MLTSPDPTQEHPPPQPTPTSPNENDSAHTPDSQWHKRDYLNLLPTAHIIEICLLLDLQVPSHIRHTIWPTDIQAAIQILKKSTTTNHAFSRTDHPPNDGSTSQGNEAGVPSSSSNSAPGASYVPGQTTPDPLSASTATADTQPNSSGNSSTPSNPPPHPNASNSQPPYPYGAYGYPVQGQPAYPHSPYYTPPGYAPPYPGYPPYPPPPPGYPPHPAHAQSYSNHQPLSQAPPTTTSGAQQISAEELPSYEEMIVEALLEITDPEGAAPKDMFAWMSARYPLQTNFRPSASQALQKAFRRGRLEKRPGGKYRLNASWNGTVPSRRTTRRPQTVAQAAYAAQSPSQISTSPFTHTPLASRQPVSTSPPTPQAKTAQSSPYGSYSYGYHGYPPYTGYAAPPTSSAPLGFSNSGTKNDPRPVDAARQAEKSTKEPAEENGAPAEGVDAWEAAQHIFQAINLGMQEKISEEASSRAGRPSDPPPNTASPGLELLHSVGGSLSDSSDPSRVVLTDEERASLQAQLALLASQLSEIAELEDEEGNATDEEGPESHVAVEYRPSVVTAGSQTSGATEPHTVTPPDPQEYDDEDDDMEMVEVPTLPTEIRT